MLGEPPGKEQLGQHIRTSLVQAPDDVLGRGFQWGRHPSGNLVAHYRAFRCCEISFSTTSYFADPFRSVTTTARQKPLSSIA